jgi:hypothetical protein
MNRYKDIESIDEIKQRFPREWVLISNCSFDKLNCLSKGRVIAHSKDRSEIYKKLMRYKEPLAVEYTGPIPKDLAVMF